MEIQSTSTDLRTSTFLVANIHCPSCASYATDVLSPFSEDIRQIDVSIVDHTIRVRHFNDITRKLVKELVDAAFEVEHVSVTDTLGRTIQDVDVQQHEKRVWLSGFFDTLFMSKAQKKHIENCNACQEQRRKKKKPLRATTWADVLRSRSTSADIERGALDRASLDSKGQCSSATHDGQVQDSKNGVHVATITIEGMTCSSCVATITDTLRELDYVESTDVNLVANSAKVVFHGPRDKADDIKVAIEDVGYDANVVEVHTRDKQPNVNLQQASLSIDGMTCGSCVGTVTRAIQELPFVQNVDVDLLTNSASVVFDGSQNLEAIRDQIEDSGYDATVISIHHLGSATGTQAADERSVQIQVTGMYCPKCPTNMVTAINSIFSGQVKVTRQPTLKSPQLTVTYRPNAPTVTIRRIIEGIDSVDPACSASVYHPPSLEERSRAVQRKERNRLVRHLLVAFVIAIPSFVIGVVYMSLVPADNQTRKWFEEPLWAGNAMRIDWALFILTTPAMFYGASVFHTRALKEFWTLWKPTSKVPILRRFYRFGSMNLLISAGTSVAYFASLAVLIMDATSPRQSQPMNRKSTTYFDTVTFLTFFILIGRFLEAYSKARTGDAVSMLANLRPSTAMLIETDVSKSDIQTGPSMRQISVDLLEIGDTINIAHGACPPTDGQVAQDGVYLFDESSLTGESRPVKKGNQDRIFTGSVNIGDPLRMTVTELGGKSMLDQIVAVVREGQAKRAPIERLADVLTGYFTPVITLLAISTWIIWLALGESGVLPPTWLDVPRGGWAYWSVEFAVAVFVVACPCGIGLAAPTALFVGGGLAAKNGVLVQGGGEAFQEASKLDAIVFDKTGTLTQGRMQVTDEERLPNNLDLSDNTIAAIAKALEEASTHPIAKAIVQHCDNKMNGGTEQELQMLNIQEISGRGMSGRFQIRHGSETKSYEVVIGNQHLLSTVDTNEVEFEKETDFASRSTSSVSNVFLASTLSRFQLAGNSTAILAVRPQPAVDQRHEAYSPVSIFAIADPLRDEAIKVLKSVRSAGLDVYMCTGDNVQTAQSVASQLSIPPSNIRAGVLPHDKAKFIEELQNASTRRRIVGFVGDGTNDTPALTVADVSIAMSHPEGGGSDIALTSSSFVLLNSDLNSILALVKLSKRVFLRVKLNFMWAAIYNICLLPVAAGVFFPIGATYGQNAHGGFRLNPVWASIAMAGSSVSVVLSSLALRLPEIEFGALKRLFTRQRE